jgi:excisionase family DNA binding protein
VYNDAAGEDPLPSVQIGRHRLFYRSELEGWLAQRA